MPIEFSLKESKVLKDIFIIRPTISNDIRGNIWTSFLYQEIDRLIPKISPSNTINFQFRKIMF